MYRLYWPVIKFRDHEGSARTFSTCGPCHTRAQARDVIRTWAEDFHILSARVDVYDGSVFPVRKIRTYNFF